MDENLESTMIRRLTSAGGKLGMDGLRRAGRWSRLAVGPAAATGVASLITLVATGLILRELPTEEAGHFALLIALIETIGLLAAHGFPTVVTRLYSAAGSEHYNWPADLVSSALYAAPLLAGAIVLSYAIYGLGPVSLGYLALSGLTRVVLHVFAFMINAERRYASAALLLRLPNTLLILPAGLIFLRPSFATLETILVAHFLAILTILITALAFYGRTLNRGRRRVGFDERKRGLIFVISAATLTVPDSGLIMVSGVFLSAEQLATFAAIAILVRPFKLIRSILSMVLMPEFIRNPKSTYRSLQLMVWGGGLVAAVAAVLVGVPLVQWFYQGRYFAGLGLIPLLALAGWLHLTSVIPRAYVGSRATTAFVNQSVIALTLSLVITVGVSAPAIALVGLYGLGAAAIGVELVRLIASHIYWRRLLSIESSGSVDMANNSR